MKVLKFGGTSVGSPERIQGLTQIVDCSQEQIVVLSAVAGTTDALDEISNLLCEGKRDIARIKIDELYKKYKQFIKDLFKTDKYLKKAKELIDNRFQLISSLASDLFTNAEKKVVLAQGELMSTAFFHYHLGEVGQESVLLPSLDFMRTDEDNEPDIDYIRTQLTAILDNSPKDNKIYIAQGYICRNAFGEIDNLRRGGSDFTASLIGAAIQADEVQIWTDIDGMHNNDPRVVDHTTPISNLSFDEAAELAYFGAKILHPQSIFPAQKYNVPVRLLNTMDPQAYGTLINAAGDDKTIGVRAIAAKDNITAIHIKSSRMLLAYGFLRRVFEVFERYKTPIDMITTSEVSVSLTIDDSTYLKEIIEELQHFGQVDVDENQTIICVVGTFDLDTKGYAAKIFDGINHLSIRMISYGGSNHNVSLLIDSVHKKEALQSLHNHLF